MTSPARPIALVISGDPEFLRWTKTCLDEMEILSLPAQTAACSMGLLDALRGVSGRAPDIAIICDPVEDLHPLRLCRLMRQQAGLLTTPILLLLDQDGPALDERARLEGASDVLSKRTAADALRGAIRGHLRAVSGAAVAAGPVVSFQTFKRFLVESLGPSGTTADQVQGVGCRDLYALATLLGTPRAVIARRLASHLGLPYLACVPSESIDWTVLPLGFSLENGALAVRPRDRHPLFVLSNPFLPGLLDALGHSRWAARSPGLAIADPDMIQALLLGVRSAPGGMAAVPGARVARPRTVRSPITRCIRSETATAAERGPRASAMADELLREAVRLQASEVLIEPREGETLVRFRIDGELGTIQSLSGDVSALLAARLKTMAGMDASERRRSQHGVAEVSIHRRDFRLRLATTCALAGECLTIKLIEPATKPMSLAALGMSDAQASWVEEMSRRDRGLIVLAGLAGSGRSTTAQSVLSGIDGHARGIVTIEDPIERRLSLARQREVDERTGNSFQRLFESAIREAPDVMFMGEVRHSAWATASLDFARSHGLAIATVQATNATMAISRLGRLGIGRETLSQALLGVVAQTLLRVLCPRCKRSEPLSTDETARLAPYVRTLPELVGHPVGCAACRGTGYRGRTAIVEILSLDGEMRDLIRSGASVAEIRARQRELGHALLADRAIEKIREGLVSVQDAYDAVLVEAAEFLPGRAAAAGARGASDGGGSILVVDDDPDLLTLVERMIDGSGHEVVLATDSVDTMVRLARRRFDLILLDIGLPDVDGLRLLDALEQKGIDTPVLMMTAMSDDELAGRLAGIGPLEVLRKPFTKDGLLARVSKVLAERTRREAQTA